MLSEEALVHVPSHLSFEKAASLPCAAVTAWVALTGRRRVIAGDTVLTQGSGGVSVFALQFARLLGARVIATTSTPEKTERLKALGASEVINYKETPDWDQKARELTDGRGVDSVVEIGGPGTVAMSLSALAVGGHLSLIRRQPNAVRNRARPLNVDRPWDYTRLDQCWRKPSRSAAGGLVRGLSRRPCATNAPTKGGTMLCRR